MNIVIIEPFFTGSHKCWAIELKKYSSHNIEIISLPGRFWKWRMHGGAITLAKRYNILNFEPDLILVTDMLNLPVFKSLIEPKCPIHIYFHENQFTYPWSPIDEDVKYQRDKHYGFINYSSALTANHIYFNSHFHFNSFFTGLEDFLRQFPDYREIQNIEHIKIKSSVLNLGIDLKKFDSFEINKKNKTPLILWNHRWEYDKNPELFFNILINLSKQKINFNLAVIGQEFKTEAKCFLKARNILNKHIVQFGYVESFEKYAYWLWKADILPITSIHDFFGISIMEAIYCKTIPILPRRLTYPILFKEKENPELFYDTDQELYNIIKSILEKNFNLDSQKYKKIANNYDWSNLINRYDKTLATNTSK